MLIYSTFSFLFFRKILILITMILRRIFSFASLQRILYLPRTIFRLFSFSPSERFWYLSCTFHVPFTYLRFEAFLCFLIIFIDHFIYVYKKKNYKNILIIINDFYIYTKRNYKKCFLQASKCDLCISYGSIELFHINWSKNHLNCFKYNIFSFHIFFQKAFVNI